VRGASALEPVLAEAHGAPVRTLIVWEPVIWSDIAPPTSSVLALLRDARARQFWDPDRAVSQEIVRSVDEDPKRYGFDEPLGDGDIVWDVVAVFPPGAVWNDGELPVPTYYDGPVAYRTEPLARALGRALGRGGAS
jgi:hypothetical protein